MQTLGLSISLLATPAVLQLLPSVWVGPKSYEVVVMMLLLALMMVAALVFWETNRLREVANNGFEPMAASALAIGLALVFALSIPMAIFFRKLDRSISSRRFK